MKVKFFTYHVTRPHIELKLAVFETCSNFLDMGWAYSFSIDARSDPKRFFDDWPSRSRFSVKFQNQKLAKNGEFDFAWFLHSFNRSFKLRSTHFQTLFFINPSGHCYRRRNSALERTPTDWSHRRSFYTEI